MTMPPPWEKQSISSDGMCEGRPIFWAEHLMEHFGIERDGRVFAALPVHVNQDGDEVVFCNDFMEFCDAIGAPLPPPFRGVDN